MGGSGYGNHAHKKKLENAGLTELDRNAFLRDNLYLVSNIDDELVQKDSSLQEAYTDNAFYAFQRYMKKEYPAAYFEKVDTICDGVFVYKVSR